ncbi:Sodium/calcium exchanger protein-domain-containing protein [Russula vinacea]|nr:Sodium/calcium exchanger protein-domain-containing protein [Russula vinacea]
MSPTSNESHFTPTSETHQLVSLVSVPDQQPSDHITLQPQMDLQATEQKTNERRIQWWRWRRITTLFWAVCRSHKREGPNRKTLNVRASIIAIFKTSWLNVLLIFIPLSWIFHYVKLSNTLVFVFSFLAIVPLAKLLAFATDDLSLRFGQTLAGLLNATLIIALVKCELTVVQSSLIGSILSNLLLVLGMCFFAGGTRFSEQGFGISAVQLNSSLLTLSVIAVLLPAAFHNAVQPTDGSVDPLTNQQEGHDILSISHGVVYLCYLVFQLFSHKNIYDDDHSDVQQSVHYSSKMAKRLHIHEPPASSSPPPIDGAMHPAQQDASLEAGPEEEAEGPEMCLQMTISLLAVVTVLVAVTAEFLVDSIDGLTSSGHISKGFVGLILLPIVGNAAEHVTAVTVSVKDKITLSLGVAVGSSIQIALFVIPYVCVRRRGVLLTQLRSFMVTLGWILGKPLTLLFDPFESIVLFLSVLTVNYVVQDGKSNWLEGMILMCLYTIIAVTFWYYPVSDPAGLLATCQ